MFHISESDRHIQRLRRFTRITRGLTHLTRSGAVYEILVHGALELVGAERALLLIENDCSTFSPVVSSGIDADLASLQNMKLDDQLRIRLGNIVGEPMLAIPLLVNGNIHGVLGIHCGEEPATAEEEWLLSALMDHGALALSHARMLEQDEDRLKTALPMALNTEEQRQFLMSAMAHDLRSPLLSIRMGCDILEDTIDSPTPEQREILGHIRMARHHVQMVAENLLEMGRLSAGMSVLDCKKIDAISVLDEAIAVIAPEAQSRGFSLEQSGLKQLMVNADGPRLRQVYVNLLGNAMKYAPEGSSIRIEHIEDRNAGLCKAAITDEGPGISLDEQERIFAPYYRAIQPDQPNKSGVGLGLAISRELVRKMGGDIQVKSEPGKGATFTVILASS